MIPAKLKRAAKNRPYQIDAIKFGLKAGSFGLFDEPGLGKTIEVLGVITHAPGGKHVVLCPSVAVGVWASEIERWTDARAIQVTGTRARRLKQLALPPAEHGHTFYIMNHEMARQDYPDLFSTVWDTCVVDEAHDALIRGKSQLRKGMMKVRAERRIAVTGTPMRGHPEQMWGTLNWIDRGRFSSYWRWIGTYFQTASNGFSDHIIDGFQPGAEDRMQRDNADIVLRRTKAEVLPQLPPKMYSGGYIHPDNENSPYGVWLSLEGEHKRQYREFEREGYLEFDDGSEFYANGGIVEYTRKKQLANGPVQVAGDRVVPKAAGPKWDWLVAKIAELGIPETGRIVVATQFTALITVWADELERRGIPCHRLTGKTTDRARREAMADFQSDAPRARVFFLNQKAGGTAITLDMSDDLVLVDEPTIPATRQQVEDRVHRASRMHSVTIHILRTLETQDEEIAWVAAARASVQRYLLDGSRGIETARRMFKESLES